MTADRQAAEQLCPWCRTPGGRPPPADDRARAAAAHRERQELHVAWLDARRRLDAAEADVEACRATLAALVRLVAALTAEVGRDG